MFEQDDEGKWHLLVVNNGSGVMSLPETGVGTHTGMPLMILGLAAVGFGMMTIGIRLVTLSTRK